MKVGSIIKPSPKGQIVIPKEFREELSIDEHSLLHLIIRGNSLWIYPVEGVVPKVKTEDSYHKILAQTQGAWIGEDWQRLRSKRKKLELKASKKRKVLW